jgi:hypothetical protein
MGLSDKEKMFLGNIARRKNLYLTFSIISVLVAVMLLVYHGLIMREMNSIRVLLIILILLTGKAHLRQYRSAVILFKLKPWLEISGDENKINKR